MAGSPFANRIRGHILVEVFIDGEWYLVDNTAGKLFLDYDRNNLSLCDGYYAFAKSIEVRDSGVLDEQDNAEAMHSLFRGFDPARYKNPKYDYIDLLSGVRKTSGAFVPDQQQPGSNNGQSQALIIGLKEPVELFAQIYSPRSSRVYMGSYMFVGVDKIHSASTIVMLCADSGDPDFGSAPEHFFEYFPELNKSGEMVLSYQQSGKRIVIIKAPTVQRLIQMVEQLPGDILTKDYR